MSRPARVAMVDRAHPSLPVVRQCQLLDLARSSIYYRPVPADPDDLVLMRAIDEQYLKTPFATHGRHAETPGAYRQSQAGATADATDGDRGDLSEAEYQQEAS
ncbi:MAG: integrase catalytic subunit [bacterium]|nr:MAG: integrase catalytic subunit [bacterium]